MDQLIKAKQKTPRISGGLIILKAAVAETAVLKAVGGQTDLSSSVGEGEGGSARDCRSYEMVHGRQLRIRVPAIGKKSYLNFGTSMTVPDNLDV